MDTIEEKTIAFKKELKELLTKYNAEISAESEETGFSTEVIIDIDNKEIIRVFDSLSQYDI